MLWAGDIEIDVPESVTVFLGCFSVSQDPAVQDGKTPSILISHHASQICLCNHVIFQRNIVNHIAALIVLGLDHPGVVIEGRRM